MVNKLINTLRRHPIRFTIFYYALYMVLFIYAEKHCTGSDIHLIHSSLDRLIPFCKYAVVPYVIWFPFIFLSIVYFLFFGSKREFWRVTLTLFTGMIGTVIFYQFVKTGLNLRPAYIVGNDIFTKAVRLIWSMDTPTNVCPSIHVLVSVGIDLCWSHSKAVEKHPALRWFIHILSVSIILSTVLLKQHSVIDVSLGLLCGFAAYYIAEGICIRTTSPVLSRRKAKARVY